MNRLPSWGTFRLIFLLWLLLPLQAIALPEGFQLETVVSGLNQPVYLTQLPDGRMLIGTKPGRILIFDPTATTPAVSDYLEINNISTGGERGFTSMVLDPQFEQNGFFYVYYTHASSQRNRISRFSHLGDRADPASEVLVWQDNEPYEDCCHYGGGLAFGPDGKLYLATGEEFDGPQSQDLTRAGGKIIRINSDGSIPEDNPFVDGPGGNLDEIWALGLRNPYRAHWDLIGGRFFIAEVGGNDQANSREDIHLGRAGANYGWPYCEGVCGDPAYDEPIYDYGHVFPGGAGGAVTLGTVYRGSQFPASYQGVLFFTDYVQGWVRYLSFDAAGGVASVQTLAERLGPIVHLIEGRDGALYLADISGSVRRISYRSGNQPPRIEVISYDPAPGPAPATVTFGVEATDPEGDSLTYLWLLGDGVELSGRTVSHEYLANGVYSVRVLVSDGNRSTLSEPVTVQVGNPPVVTITAPLEGSLFRAGDEIYFAGAAIDPDEVLPDSSYVWDIRFGHNTHTHPALTGYVGPDGVLPINDTGHDYHDDTRYEIELTVTDSDGLTSRASVTIYPDKADLTLATAPIQTEIFLDGLPVQAPRTYDTLIGFRHLVSVAAKQCIDGTQYMFSSWSDGGALSHEITVPESGLALTANFVAAGACDTLPTDGMVLHLEADAGVQLEGAAARVWQDLSGQGNDLVAFGNPQLLPGALNGRPIVRLNGQGDKFERIGQINGLPANNDPRTVVMLVSYHSGGYGGFLYGRSSCNNAIGLGVKPQGTLVVDAWCQNWSPGTPGVGAGWLVQAAVVEGTRLRHYRDGELIQTRTHAFDTVVDRIVLGANLDSGKYVDMQVAAVLVYNRALSEAELAQVQAYLSGKYLAPRQQPPVAVDDSASVMFGGAVDIAVLANDVDADGQPDPGSLEILQEPLYGSVTVNPASGIVSYVHGGTSSASDSFRYRVADHDGLYSNSALVTVAVLAPSDEPPVAADDVVSVLRGGELLIPVLDNDLAMAGELVPDSLHLTRPPQHGEASVAADGRVRYVHGGGADAVDSFGYRVLDDAGRVSNEALVTIMVSSPGALPRGGLVLHLESDWGVEQVGGVVSVWADQSGLDNSLSARGAPQYLAGALNGLPVIGFDGAGAALERTAALNGLPAGNADRTVYLLVNYQSVGYGGFGWGEDACNRLFATSVRKTGELMVQGWCGKHDFKSSAQGTGAGWLIHSAVLQDGELRQYRGGELIGVHRNVYDTALTRLVLGAEIDYDPYLTMQVAAILVYDRALAEPERLQVLNYLNSKYALE